MSARPDNSLTSIADELYGVVPEQFVSVRDDRIKAARDSGDRTLAAAIRSLRKPTVAAFAVNLLVRERRAAVEELLALGDALREAQQELSPTELRALSQQRHRVVRALVDDAAERARGRGVRVDTAALDQVQATLDAALTHPERRDEVLRGQLDRAVDPSTDPSMTLTWPTTGAIACPPARSGSAATETSARRSDTAAARRREQERAHRTAAAQEAVRAAEAALEEAERAVADAESARVDAADRLEQLREQVREAERRVAEAALDARTAGRQRDSARRDVEQARAALDRLARA